MKALPKIGSLVKITTQNNFDYYCEYDIVIKVTYHTVNGKKIAGSFYTALSAFLPYPIDLTDYEIITL